MKQYFLLFLFLFTGCVHQTVQIKATTSDSEVVVAEGSAPIINNDILGAKKTAQEDALKNALGLVIGVYVSQESLVSKAMLIEDNITSKTEGYIEKYTVIKEQKDGDFYKITVKALVRKEDLSAKIKALNLEPKKLGNPIVKFEIEETIDGNKTATDYATNELKKKFLAKGFVVSEAPESDILISGKVQTSFNTDQGLAGFISYRANIEINVKKTNSQDIIITISKIGAGIDVTKEAAAKKAIQSLAITISNDLPDNILKFLQKQSTLQLTISNVGDIKKLNSILNSVRSLIEVRDCLTRNYQNGLAVIELDIKNGDANQIAKRIEQLNMLKIKKITAYNIDGELI